jgi:quercetin dioxygenase-like cupin family protein
MSSSQPTTRTEIPAADIVNVSGLSAYQEGSVVSRTIIKREKGNVTLFAFDQGQGLSEHTAPFDALAHVLEGEVEITVSGKPMQVKAGEMVLMPADQPHALKAITKFKMLLTMIRSA